MPNGKRIHVTLEPKISGEQEEKKSLTINIRKAVEQFGPDPHQVGGEELGIRAKGPMDLPPVEFIESKVADVKEFVRENVGTIGTVTEIGAGIAGNIAGGAAAAGFPPAVPFATAAGGFVATTIADLFNQKLKQSLYPDAPAEMSFKDAATRGALNEVLTLIPVLGQARYAKRLYKSIDPDIKRAMLRWKELKPTVGQVTQARFPRIAEDLLTGGLVEELEREQFQVLANKILPEIREKLFSKKGIKIRPTEVYGRIGQRRLARNFKVAKLQVDDAYEYARSYAQSASRTFKKITGHEESKVLDQLGNPLPPKPITEDIVIRGPIDPANARIFIDEIKPAIDALTTGEIFERIPVEFQGSLRVAKKAIDDMVRGTKVLNPKTGEEYTSYLMSWDSVKTLRTAIRDITWAEKHLERGEGILSALQGVLGKDIEESVLTLWGKKEGSAAWQSIKTANELNTKFWGRFNKKIQELYGWKGDLKIDPGDFFNKANTNRSAARRLKDALGPGNTEIQKGAYFDYLVDIGTKEVGKEFRPIPALNALKSRNGVANIILEPKEITLIEDFFNAIKAAGRRERTGEVALALREASLKLHVTSRVLTSPLTLAAGGSALGIVAGTGFAVTGIGIIVSARQFVKHVLLRPSHNKLANRLAKIDWYSPEAISHTKTLLLAMKGTQVLLEFPNGMKVQAQINEQGRLAPLFVFGQE